MNWENLVVNLECIDSLPTLPTILIRVSRMINDPRVTAKKVAEVIETDQAISMKLLKVVNSPFFGFSRKIMTVQDAVVLLGFNATRNTVLSISVMNTLGKESVVEGFDLHEFWRHSIATGLASRFLARKARFDHEKAFVAGIVHDIGKIVLQQYFREELEHVLQTMRDKKVSFYEAELAVYNGTHSDLGSYLADKWNLPLPLIEAIDLHHRPGEAAEEPALVSVVHIANAVASGLGYGFAGSTKNTDLDAQALECLDFSAAHIEGWLEDLQDELQQSEEIFELLNA